MKENFLKGLYDMAGIDVNGEKNQSFNEEKLKREILENPNAFRQNKDIFKEEKNYHSCLMYHPCPICHKCLNKASHLYVKCQNCKIPICTHTYKDRCRMIKRENFKLQVDKETLKELRELINSQK